MSEQGTVSQIAIQPWMTANCPPSAPIGKFALEMGNNRFRRIIVITAAANAASAMFAVDESAVRLDRIAVHEPCSVDHHLDMSVKIPSEQSPIWHV